MIVGEVKIVAAVLKFPDDEANLEATVELPGGRRVRVGWSRGDLWVNETVRFDLVVGPLLVAAIRGAIRSGVEGN